jgi:hypothetical protein
MDNYTNIVDTKGLGVRFAFQVTSPDGQITQWVGSASEADMSIEHNVDYDNADMLMGGQMSFLSSQTTDMHLTLKNIHYKVIVKPGESHEASDTTSPEPF